ncbi:MAG: hypothetical protein AB7O56_08175 [Bauldia sp.]
MADDGKTFKKAPPRKAAKGRKVAISAEAREIDAAEIRLRDEREKNYGLFLAPEDTKRR